MINFERHRLDNGLRVLCHQDTSTPMICVNVLYDVGARDESPDRTGLAHLFEHLMFSGSVNIPVYDQHVESAGGENNAFTNNDITNYYLTLPASALHTAMWLESDRMLGLAFSEKGLKVQKDVVVEEFRQRYLNQPYGDVWLLLRPLVYKKHPYRWPTIGMDPSHIEETGMDEVRSFFKRFYHPGNAILSVTGNVSPDQVFRAAEKWFGDIPAGLPYERSLPMESPNGEQRVHEARRDVPAKALYRAYRMVSRLDEKFYTADLISDILSAGNSSRLFRNLVKNKALFSDLSAYVTGDLDPGLFVISGKISQGVDIGKAVQAVDMELDRIMTTKCGERELTKAKNKVESVLAFSELSLSERALNLAYFELCGDAEDYNRQLQRYSDVDGDQIREMASSLFEPQNSSTLIILPSEESRPE